MADNSYTVEPLAPAGQPTVVINDDGSGNDWLIMSASHTNYSEIRLDYSTSGTERTPLAAAGFYLDFNPEPFSTGNRLVVNGIIENARGSVGDDFIVGNIFNNILLGDPTNDGPGGADIMFGDEGNDLMYGGAGADDVDGAEDDDRLFGGAGDDTVEGGLGKDTVEGGLGADTLYGGSDGEDTLSYLSSGSGVRVSLLYGDDTFGLGGHAAGDKIRGFNNIVGSAFDDRLEDLNKGAVGFVDDQYNANTFYGGGGNDQLILGGYDDRGYGGAGGDTLRGEDGMDRLWGDAGSDTLLGGLGRDTLQGGDGFDYLSGEAGGDVLYGGALRDQIYGGGGNDAISGDAGNDLIFANEGADTVTGGDGDDDISGQRGADVLRGGAGADTFFYFTTGEGGDRILDMTGADRVEFQLPFGAPTIGWDNQGTLDANRARLVDTGTNMELRINLDSDSTVEFRIVFVGTSSVTQGQIEF
jgi:Ca2+-binding RTX toxin-like protein